MEASEMIWIAKRAVAKNLDFEELKYSDYLYGKESCSEAVWAYVEECEEIGTKAFYEKYPD